MGTVFRALKHVEKSGVKDPRIMSITDKDLKIINLGQEEIDRRLSAKEELEKMRTVEVSQVIKESTARYTILRGGATDENGAIRSLKDVTEEDLIKMIR
jgi:hypothetical protein